MTKSCEWFQNESLTDDQLLARCNEQFCRGPIGLWSTYGNELTLFTGLSIWFSANRSGIVYFWDIPETKYELTTEFRWRCDRDFEVELDPINHANPADRWGKDQIQVPNNPQRIQHPADSDCRS